MSEREDFLALIDSGTTHYRDGRHDEALADFDKATAHDAGAAEAFHGRGLVHQHKDDSKAALADFDRAIELDPLHVDALFARSIAHRRMGAFEKAAADFDQAVQTLWRQRPSKNEPDTGQTEGDARVPLAESSTLEKAA
jgi:tetratricopeptide (TPR) repeat protein